MDTNDEALSNLARGMDRRQAELVERLNGGRRGRGNRHHPQSAPQRPDDDWLSEIRSLSPEDDTRPVAEVPRAPSGVDGDHQAVASVALRASRAAERLSQLAASLGSEPPAAVDAPTHEWLVLAAEEIDRLLATRPGRAQQPDKPTDATTTSMGATAPR
jgi:hypothetical protein